MAEGRRPLATEEYDDLETDDTGALFWKGKKVRLGGWSIGERIALITACVAILALIVNGITNYSAIKALVDQLGSHSSQQTSQQTEKKADKPTGTKR